MKLKFEARNDTVYLSKDDGPLEAICVVSKDMLTRNALAQDIAAAMNDKFSTN